MANRGKRGVKFARTVSASALVLFLGDFYYFSIWMAIVIVMKTTISYTKGRRVNCRERR